MAIIKKISLGHNMELAFLCERIEEEFPILHTAIEAVEAKGYQIVTVAQNRGRTRHTDKSITIPVWAFTSQKGVDYVIYYVAHEVAHAMVGPNHQHNEIFMAELIRICPPHLIKHELDYKPRNAKAAGISYNPLDDM